jgi:predicted dehydrogenase
MSKTIGVALVGCGGITLQNHMPGLALCKNAKLTALCDADEKVLERARQQTGISVAATDYKEIIKRDDVDAVIIATPNFVHAPITLAAVASKKHVFCEKPIAMNTDEAVEMFNAAEKAGVRHMTAFTYRFVPAMRYMAHLIKSGAIGQPYHYRSCRLQDWGTRALGWRQVAKLAGSGELGDMLSHRIDYAHLLLGEIVRLSANTRRFHDDRSGQKSDLEDWVALIADFANNATGVLESSKVATGRGESAHSQDYVEVNGSEGTIVYQLEQPLELQVTKRGESKLRSVKVPDEFLKWPGSPRDPRNGDPLFTFRYDQTFEFIDGIASQRPCTPSFYDGAVAQAVMDTALKAAAEKRWLDVNNPLKGRQPR